MWRSVSQSPEQPCCLSPLHAAVFHRINALKADKTDQPLSSKRGVNFLFPAGFLSGNVQGDDLNLRQKKKRKQQQPMRGFNLFTHLFSQCVLLHSVHPPKPVLARARARAPLLSACDFYFKILGRGGENYKRLGSYLLPSRIQDHRSWLRKKSQPTLDS